MGTINKYYIQSRKRVNLTIEKDEKDWKCIDPECEFYDLELAFRVARLIADYNPKMEFRVVRDLKVIPTV